MNEDSKNKYFELFKFLIMKTSNVNCFDDNGITPLLECIKNNYVEFLNELLLNPNIKIDQEDLDGI